MGQTAAMLVDDDNSTLWRGFAQGDPSARDQLLSLHYQEFRQLARRVLNGDAAVLPIQATDLAHEAAIRLLRLDRVSCRDRTHFMALSARVMRQVLLDEVRRFRAAKRRPPVLTRWHDPEDPTPAAVDMEAFDDSHRRLEAIDPVRARVVELRFYAGLTLEEIADVTGDSVSTVKRRWRAARAWLAQDLGVD